MFSVTSEAASSASFQGTPQRPARSDQAPANDIFAALVDSNSAANNSNDPANAAAPQQPGPQRSNDAPSAANNNNAAPANATYTNLPTDSPPTVSDPDDGDGDSPSDANANPSGAPGADASGVGKRVSGDMGAGRSIRPALGLS